MQRTVNSQQHESRMEKPALHFGAVLSKLGQHLSAPSRPSHGVAHALHALRKASIGTALAPQGSPSHRHTGSHRHTAAKICQAGSAETLRPAVTAPS